MRGGFSSIQQTLTPEAASVLTHSIAEAGRRNHGQTTPLHVAATLLSSPGGFLRQACIRSHPNSSHPLQCRALELCFSVALERLPAAQTSEIGDPPVSNALMAALKRAQAHQRRGCPENQQQPLLAVKVELDQLIISILDDPSVSRVMREASFSSPAVKAAIEHGLSCRASSGPGSSIGLGFRPGPTPIGVAGGGRERNLYLNPRLQQQQQPQYVGAVGFHGRSEDVKKVMEILSRPKKRNPVLVGDSEPREVVREILTNIEKHDGIFQSVEIVSIEKELKKLNELSGLIETKTAMKNSRGKNGVILDLGDLKWLIDQPSNQASLEAARTAVSDLGKIMRKFGEESKIWVIGTATCETYLRCQVYHPSMENEWDLQVVSIVAKSYIHGMLPRHGSNGGILSKSIEFLSPMKNFSVADSCRRFRCCPQCTEKYSEEVLTKSVESDKLPPWLQNAKLQASDDLQKTEELQKKWSQKCHELHPNFHLNLLGRKQPKALQPDPRSPPVSPVRTDLILGPTQHSHSAAHNKARKDRVHDFLGCISSEPQTELLESDVDSFKRLLKGLTEKVWWQTEAASSLASAITRSKSGYTKRRGGGSRGDVWLLFSGPDRIGKIKMSSALSEVVCGYGVKPIVISLGSIKRYVNESTELTFRGKTTIDRIAEGVRRNNSPSVMVLEDIDEADMVVRSSITRAMEKGRLADSHGREISLGNVIFVITSSCVPPRQQLNRFSSGGLNEERMVSLASGGWQLRISVMCEKSIGKSKRSPPLNIDGGDRSTKLRKEIGSFDLNRVADNEDERLDGSNNSSDVTMDHEDERVLENRESPTSSTSYELFGCVDEAIIFKPVDVTRLRPKIEKSITSKFTTVLGETVPLKIENEALERIISGIWLGQTSLETWVDNVLGPSVLHLKNNYPEGKNLARLELDKESDSRGQGEWLPEKISVATAAAAE